MSSISIITICFNNKSDLITSCTSIDKQTIKPLEHIIINGSTNDEIKKYLDNTSHPDYRKWISEPDKGIADAFNKGIILAKGDILTMLNSGDTLYNNEVLKVVADTFLTHHEITWLHGKYELIRGNTPVIIGKPFEKSKLYRGMRSVSHQTMFVMKSLHQKYGLYAENEKIAMDYDFLCRIANEPFVFLSHPLITFAPSGISSRLYLQSLKEAKRVYEKYFGKNFYLFFWQVRLKILYHLLHSPFGNFLYKIKVKLKLENL